MTELYPCLYCKFTTHKQDLLTTHYHNYHNNEREFILYLECTGSIEGRNTFNEAVDVEPIDCTGGQAAFEDGDLKHFAQQAIANARATGYKLYGIYRMYDPGLGLCFTNEWLQGGIKAGTFTKYLLPEDVQAPEFEDDR